MPFIAYLFCAALMVLPACAKTIERGPSLDVSGNRFSEAMRWKDYIGAGNFLRQEIRKGFLDQFQQDEDLHIVESRIVSVDLKIDKAVAEADYRLEYYRLPSMRVKKWQWLQQWRQSEGTLTKPTVWQITNAPPPLP